MVQNCPLNKTHCEANSRAKEKIYDYRFISANWPLIGCNKRQFFLETYLLTLLVSSQSLRFVSSQSLRFVSSQSLRFEETEEVHSRVVSRRLSDIGDFAEIAVKVRVNNCG